MENINTLTLNRKIGKIIFVVIISLGLGLHFYYDSLENNYEKSEVTLDKYIEGYDEYKKKLEVDPEYLWIYPVLSLIIFTIIFFLYEFSGLLFQWIISIIKKTVSIQPRFGDEIKMRINSSIPGGLQDMIERELESNEKIQWVDMPVPKFFTPVSTPAFLFAIPWTAFAVFWMFGASQSPSTVFPLFGIPFVLIGIGMLSSPLWAYFKSLKSVYVITSERAITIDGGKSFTIRSYTPDKLQNIYRKERKGGTGDVIISFKAWKDSDGDTHKTDIGFLNIKEPKNVEVMLKKLAEQKKITA